MIISGTRTWPRRGRALRPLLALLAVLLAGACGRWQREEYPTPWVAPGRTVEPWFKLGSDPGLGRPEWRDTVRGRRYDPRELRNDIERFMLERGMFERWPETGATDYNNGERTREVIAPFRFSLVSVDPMVVLATPWPFTRDTHELDMPNNADQHFPGIRRMRNFIEVGTHAPFAEGMQYFLPELGVAPTPVRWSGDEATIPLRESERLVLTRRDSVVETRRVGP